MHLYRTRHDLGSKKRRRNKADVSEPDTFERQRLVNIQAPPRDGASTIPSTINRSRCAPGLVTCSFYRPDAGK